jgi:hypothetical protein
MLNNKSLTLMGGMATAIIALFVFIDQITFDRELFATETRIVAGSAASDRRILERLLESNEVLIAQQRQQFLTLKRDLLAIQIDRLTDSLRTAPPSEIPYIEDLLDKLERRLESIEIELESMLLNGRGPY